MQAGCNSEWECVEASTPHKQPRSNQPPNASPPWPAPARLLAVCLPRPRWHGLPRAPLVSWSAGLRHCAGACRSKALSLSRMQAGTQAGFNGWRRGRGGGGRCIRISRGFDALPPSQNFYANWLARNALRHVADALLRVVLRVLRSVLCVACVSVPGSVWISWC